MYLDILKHFFYIQDPKKEQKDCFEAIDNHQSPVQYITTLRTTKKLHQHFLDKSFSLRNPTYKEEFIFSHFKFFLFTASFYIFFIIVASVLYLFKFSPVLPVNWATGLAAIMIIQNTRRLYTSMIKGQVLAYMNELNFSKEEEIAKYTEFFLKDSYFQNKDIQKNNENMETIQSKKRNRL